MRTTIRMGGVDATLSDGLEDAIRRIVDGISGGAGRVLTQELDGIAARALGEIPVRSGRYRASVGRYLDVRREEVRSGIRAGGANAPYAYMVKFGKKSGKKGNVFAELIRKPAVAATDKVAAELAGMVGGLVGGR